MIGVFLPIGLHAVITAILLTLGIHFINRSEAWNWDRKIYGDKRLMPTAVYCLTISSVSLLYWEFVNQ